MNKRILIKLCQILKARKNVKKESNYFNTGNTSKTLHSYRHHKCNSKKNFKQKANNYNNNSNSKQISCKKYSRKSLDSFRK